MDDFPSLKKIIKERLNRAKISTGFAHLLNEENEPKSGSEGIRMEGKEVTLLT